MTTYARMIPRYPGGEGPDHVNKLREQLQGLEEQFLLRQKPTEKQIRAANLVEKKGISTLATVARVQLGLPRHGMPKSDRPWHEQFPDKKESYLDHMNSIRGTLGLSDRFYWYIEAYVIFGRNTPELIDPCPLFIKIDPATFEPMLSMRIYGDTTIEEINRKWRLVRKFQINLSEAIGRKRPNEDLMQRAFNLDFQFKARKKAGKLKEGESYQKAVVDKINQEFHDRALIDSEVRTLAKRFEDLWRKRYM